MKETSQTNRLILTIIAVVIGLLLVAGAPFLIQRSLDAVLRELLVVVESQPQFLSGISLFSLFYPLWRAFCFIAGITLLLISPSIYKGEDWTFPVALTAYAMPSIGGMFMFLPYVSWVKDSFPIPMLLSFVGLAGYWSLIFLRKGDAKQKWAEFAVFTLIGVLATHSFVIGIGAARQLMTRPGIPEFQGIAWWILTMTGDVDWIGVVMLVIAIPLLALRKKAGWWLALIAAVSILAIDAPAQLIRTSTLDYLYGSLIAAALIAVLMIPFFKNHVLVDVPSES